MQKFSFEHRIVQLNPATSELLTNLWFYELTLGFTNLAPSNAAITIKNSTADPPQIPATVNEAASPFKPTSSFPKVL